MNFVGISYSCRFDEGLRLKILKEGFIINSTKDLIPNNVSNVVHIIFVIYVINFLYVFYLFGAFFI